MCLACEVAINKESAKALKTVDYGAATSNGYNSEPPKASYATPSNYSRNQTY